jgi:hypothetical protein
MIPKPTIPAMIALKSYIKEPRRFAVLLDPVSLNGNKITNNEMMYKAVAEAGSAKVRLLAVDWTPGALVEMTPEAFANEWEGD